MGWKFTDRVKYRAAYAANNDIIPHLLPKPMHSRDDFGEGDGSRELRTGPCCAV